MNKDFKITKTVRTIIKKINRSQSTDELEKIKNSLQELSEYQFLHVFKSVIRSKDINEEKMALFVKLDYYSLDLSNEEEYYFTEGLMLNKPFTRKNVFDPVDKLDTTLNYFSDWQKLIETKEAIINIVKQEVLFYQNDLNSILVESDIRMYKTNQEIVPILESVATYFESELLSDHFLSQYSDVKNEMINNFRLFNLSKPLNFSNLKCERCFLYCLTFEEWLKRYALYLQQAEGEEELLIRKKEVIRLLELDDEFYQPFFDRFKVVYTSYDYMFDEPEFYGDTVENKRWYNENWLPILDPDVQDPRDSSLFKEEVDDFEPNADYLLHENDSLIRWINNFRKNYFNPIVVENFKPLTLNSYFSKNDMIKVFENILVHYSGISIQKEVKKQMQERISLLVETFTNIPGKSKKEANFIFDHSTEKPLIEFRKPIQSKLRKAIGIMMANKKIDYKSAEDVHHSFALMFKHDFKSGFSASTLKKDFEKVRGNIPSDINDVILDPQSELILS